MMALRHHDVFLYNRYTYMHIPTYTSHIDIAKKQLQFHKIDILKKILKLVD